MRLVEMPPEDVRVKMIVNSLPSPTRYPAYDSSTQTVLPSTETTTQTDIAMVDQATDTADISKSLTGILLNRYARKVDEVLNHFKEKKLEWIRNRADIVFKDPPEVSVIEATEHIIAPQMISTNPEVLSFVEVLPTAGEINQTTGGLATTGKPPTTRLAAKTTSSKIPISNSTPPKYVSKFKEGK